MKKYTLAFVFLLSFLIIRCTTKPYCDNEFCNENISIICKNCTVQYVPRFYEYQSEIYNCLVEYLSFKPEKIIYTLNTYNSCYGDCSINAYSGRGIITMNQFPIFENKESTNIKADVHETTHAFLYFMLGEIPSWFDEGVAIYVSSNLNCILQQLEETRLSDPSLNEFYIKFKNGESKLNEFLTPHEKGAIFFFILEKEYKCDETCVLQLITNLQKYKGQKITDEVIKNEAEQILKTNLTKLFQFLEPNYTKPMINETQKVFIFTS